MTIEEVIQILSLHQKWRRGAISQPPVTEWQLSVALDDSIRQLRNLSKDMDCILPKIGTHNSATGEKGKGLISLLATPFSKCQGRDIESQINMGCRYFDIRFAIDKHGIWRAAHGLWTSKKTLDNILDELYFASRDLRQPIYVSLTLERGNPVLCRVFRAWFEARYTNLLIPTYIAHKHPKWTIYHVYNEIPCRQGFLPLDGHSWHTYIPIPWLWSKLYNNHPIFDDNSFNLVDFL